MKILSVLRCKTVFYALATSLRITGNASSVVDVFLWSCLSKTRGARFFFDTCQVTWGERKQGGL